MNDPLISLKRWIARNEELMHDGIPLEPIYNQMKTIRNELPIASLTQNPAVIPSFLRSTLNFLIKCADSPSKSISNAADRTGGIFVIKIGTFFPYRSIEAIQTLLPEYRSCSEAVSRFLLLIFARLSESAFVCLVMEDKDLVHFKNAPLRVTIDAIAALVSSRKTPDAFLISVAQLMFSAVDFVFQPLLVKLAACLFTKRLKLFNFFEQIAFDFRPPEMLQLSAGVLLNTDFLPHPKLLSDILAIINSLLPSLEGVDLADAVFSLLSHFKGQFNFSIAVNENGIEYKFSDKIVRCTGHQKYPSFYLLPLPLACLEYTNSDRYFVLSSKFETLAQITISTNSKEDIRTSMDIFRRFMDRKFDELTPACLEYLPLCFHRFLVFYEDAVSFIQKLFHGKIHSWLHRLHLLRLANTLPINFLRANCCSVLVVFVIDGLSDKRPSIVNESAQLGRKLYISGGCYWMLGDILQQIDLSDEEFSSRLLMGAVKMLPDMQMTADSFYLELLEHFKDSAIFVSTVLDLISRFIVNQTLIDIILPTVIEQVNLFSKNAVYSTTEQLLPHVEGFQYDLWSSNPPSLMDIYPVHSSLSILLKAAATESVISYVADLPDILFFLYPVLYSRVVMKYWKYFEINQMTRLIRKLMAVFEYTRNIGILALWISFVDKEADTSLTNLLDRALMESIRHYAFYPSFVLKQFASYAMRNPTIQKVFEGEVDKLPLSAQHDYYSHIFRGDHALQQKMNHKTECSFFSVNKIRYHAHKHFHSQQFASIPYHPIRKTQAPVTLQNPEEMSPKQIVKYLRALRGGSYEFNQSEVMPLLEKCPFDERIAFLSEFHLEEQLMALDVPINSKPYFKIVQGIRHHQRRSLLTRDCQLPSEFMDNIRVIESSLEWNIEREIDFMEGIRCICEESGRFRLDPGVYEQVGRFFAKFFAHSFSVPFYMNVIGVELPSIQSLDSPNVIYIAKSLICALRIESIPQSARDTIMQNMQLFLNVTSPVLLGIYFDALSAYTRNMISNEQLNTFLDFISNSDSYFIHYAIYREFNQLQDLDGFNEVFTLICTKCRSVSELSRGIALFIRQNDQGKQRIKNARVLFEEKLPEDRSQQIGLLLADGCY